MGGRTETGRQADWNLLRHPHNQGKQNLRTIRCVKDITTWFLYFILY
jgi:hypothetical protein